MKNPKKNFKKVFFVTLLCAIGFLVSLSINVPSQSALELTLNNIAVVFFGLGATVGWVWLVSHLENK